MGPDQNGHFNNLYAGTEFYKSPGAPPTYTGNWAKQLSKVIQDYPTQTFVRITGPTTASIAELVSLKNLKTMTLDTFIERINTTKDL